MKAIPVTSVNASEFEDEPYNNLKNHEILLRGDVECDDGTTIVCDSHYMDLEGSESDLIKRIYKDNNDIFYINVNKKTKCSKLIWG